MRRASSLSCLTYWQIWFHVVSAHWGRTVFSCLIGVVLGVNERQRVGPAVVWLCGVT